MNTATLSSAAKRIVNESLHDKPVLSVVGDLCTEVGPDKWDGVVTPALAEIVQLYIDEHRHARMSKTDRE